MQTVALESIRRAAGERRPVREAPGHLFENEHEEFSAALEAMLSGWIDVRALFSPSPHALRADHDEFTTFFSESSGKIADVRNALTNVNVSMVQHTAEAPCLLLLGFMSTVALFVTSAPRRPTENGSNGVGREVPRR